MNSYFAAVLFSFGFLVKIFHLEVWLFTKNGNKYVLPVFISLCIYGIIGYFKEWLDVKQLSILCVPLIQLVTLWGCYLLFKYKTGMVPRNVVRNWNMSKELEVHRIYGMLSWIIMIMVMMAWLLAWI